MTVINKHRDQAGDLVVVVNPDVLNRFKTEDSKHLVELERQHSGRLIFRSDPSLHRERFVIVDASTEKTIDPATSTASGEARSADRYADGRRAGTTQPHRRPHAGA